MDEGNLSALERITNHVACLVCTGDAGVLQTYLQANEQAWRAAKLLALRQAPSGKAFFHLQSACAVALLLLPSHRTLIVLLDACDELVPLLGPRLLCMVCGDTHLAGGKAILRRLISLAFARPEAAPIVWAACDTALAGYAADSAWAKALTAARDRAVQAVRASWGLT